MTEDESRNRFELSSHLKCMIPRTSLLVKRSKPSQVTILAGLSNFKFTTFAIFHVIWKNFREYFLRSRRRAYYFLCLRIIGRFSWITFIICKEVATLSEVRDDPTLTNVRMLWPFPVHLNRRQHCFRCLQHIFRRSTIYHLPSHPDYCQHSSFLHFVLQKCINSLSICLASPGHFSIYLAPPGHIHACLRQSCAAVHWIGKFQLHSTYCTI